MNQPTKAFLIQLRDLCRSHGVEFTADFGRVRFFTSTESRMLAAALGMYDRVEAEVERLEDLESMASSLRALEQRPIALLRTSGASACPLETYGSRRR